MTCGIYQIVNTLNGKRYVGSSVDIEKRWQKHQQDLRKGSHHAQHLQHSWNKSGGDKFIIRVIFECEREELIENEQAELDKGYDYNSSPTAGNTLGLKFSEDARARVRQNRLDRYAADPEGYAALMSSLSKGKPKSAEWKRKASESKAGVSKSAEQCEKMARSRAELTKDQVLEVRVLRPEGMGLKAIAEKTGLSWSQCRNICAGIRYQWAYDSSGPVDTSQYDKPQSRQYNDTTYEFMHEIHGSRCCTQFQLKKEFPVLSSSKVSLLCAGSRNHHRGWRIKEKAPN